jgi:hypothetical protein
MSTPKENALQEVERTADDLAREIALKYNLAARCQVNLEGTISNMMLDGISVRRIKHYLEDLYDNVEFIGDF